MSCVCEVCVVTFTAEIDCSGKTTKMSSGGHECNMKKKTKLIKVRIFFFTPLSKFNIRSSFYLQLYRHGVISLLLRTGWPPESHALFLLLGAEVPTKQQALSLQHFSVCWLVAVGPQSLFLSTLLCLPPPLLSHLLLLCFHCSAAFRKGAFGWVCVRKKQVRLEKGESIVEIVIGN